MRKELTDRDWINVIISLWLASFGVLYGVYISFFRRSDPKLTWVKVVFGTGVTAIGMSLLNLVNRDKITWLIFGPFYALGLTGVPMIICQNFKSINHTAGKHQLIRQYRDLIAQEDLDEDRL